MTVVMEVCLAMAVASMVASALAVEMEDLKEDLEADTTDLVSVALACESNAKVRPNVESSRSTLVDARGATRDANSSSAAERPRTIARFSRLWTSRSIIFPTKYRLHKSLVVTILLYGCDTWTLHADTKRRIKAFEHNCQ
ncbi:uncharacterized protein LOC127847071 [Dreissena polymorpha]|uniref:uncharacterized protein LOC127847071 n=1 Tax=Dreissena polymorpha TaxID=45954 RepID=UPI0022644434|nr:uncharacterized protein LOC127847071 [Dreissena polymorpha]